MLDSKMITFLKVVEQRSYSKAAALLHLTQPAVSQQIQRLEEHYACRLFDIRGRAIHLTAQGQALYHYANLQLANEEQLLAQMAKVETPIKVGATLSIADYYLPPYLSTYLARQADLPSVTVKNTKAIIEMLLHNKLSCAFIEGIFDKSLFNVREFLLTKFHPVARAGHPLASKTCSLGDIHRFPLLLREEGSGTREIYENYLYQNNDSLLSALSVHEISSFGVIKQVLRSSDAVSFMYEGVARQEVERGELCYLEIEGFEIERPLHFIYLGNSLLQNRIELFYDNLLEQL